MYTFEIISKYPDRPFHNFRVLRSGDRRLLCGLGSVYMELKTLPFSAPNLVPYEVNRAKLELKRGLF